MRKEKLKESKAKRALLLEQERIRRQEESKFVDDRVSLLLKNNAKALRKKYVSKKMVRKRVN